MDSGGAYLPMQDQVFPDRDHFGRIFYNQARLSAKNIPQIAVVMGSCTAGGAYVPAMSDEAIIVKGQGTIFLGGPPLVKAATGADISAEELGGADLHCRHSGVCDHLVQNDQEALEQARRLVANIGRRPEKYFDCKEPVEPLFPPDDILGLVPQEHNRYFPTREILSRILDGSELDEFKSEYGTSIICGFARIDGILVGVIANNGILFSESALKATHFIQLCGKRRIPLVFFQNIVGFMVGKDYEKQGIAKDGAKMVAAVACATVPKISIVIGGSFGAGNYAMAGRAYQPRFLFMWPNARIAVMGPEQAAGVLTQVKKSSSEHRGENILTEDLEAYREEIESSYIEQSSALYASARLWDDGIISPLDTRKKIALALKSCYNSRKQGSFGIFRT